MATRTTKKTVTFTKPFILKNVDEVLPAGAYTVETDEEPLEGISFLAFRRVLTLLHLPGKPGSAVIESVMTIDPTDLDAALERDRAGAETVGIIGLVGDEAPWPADTVQKRYSHGDVGDVAGRQGEGDRPAVIIGQSMDFARSSAARRANRLRPRPPFEPCAERCALT